MLPRGSHRGRSRDVFGRLADGRSVDRFRLAVDRMEVEFIALGAIVRSIRVPDRDGRVDDVVLGFDTLEDYENNPDYFGAIVGRYANRIRRGRFVVDGRSYQLTINDGANHLHGGARGFDRALWEGDWLADGVGVSFTHLSADGEEGYPGNLRAKVAYRLEPPSSLIIEIEATSDR